MKTKAEYMHEQVMKRVEVIKHGTDWATKPVMDTIADWQQEQLGEPWEVVAMGGDDRKANRGSDAFSKPVQCPVKLTPEDDCILKEDMKEVFQQTLKERQERDEVYDLPKRYSSQLP